MLFSFRVATKVIYLEVDQPLNSHIIQYLWYYLFFKPLKYLAFSILIIIIIMFNNN